MRSVTTLVSLAIATLVAVSIRPGACAAAGSELTTGRLPVSFHRDRWVFLPGRVDERRTELMLDSGAGITLLDSAFAAELSLELQPGPTVDGAGGSEPSQHAKGLTVKIGQFTMHGVQAAVLDLSELTAPLGRPVEVILGAEFFRVFVIEIDPENSTVAFSSPMGYRYRGRGRRGRGYPGPLQHRRQPRH